MKRTEATTAWQETHSNCIDNERPAQGVIWLRDGGHRILDIIGVRDVRAFLQEVAQGAIPPLYHATSYRVEYTSTDALSRELDLILAYVRDYGALPPLYVSWRMPQR